MLLGPAKRLAKKMQWQDISFLKASVFFFTIFLLVAWGDFRNIALGIQWYWPLGLAILFSLPLWKKIFSK